VGSKLEWIVQRDRFAQIAPAWEALARTEPDPFMRHPWLDAWWSAHPHADARVAVVWDGDQLVAGLPLMVRGEEAESFGEALLVPFRPLARDQQALMQLVRSVDALPAATVTLHSAVRGDPRTEALMRGLRASRPIVTRSHPNRFLAVETRGSWDDYRRAMRSRWGSVERKGRKLIRDHDAQLRIVEPPADLAAQLDEGFALEAQGWKGAAGTAVDRDPIYAVFLRAAARGLDAAGELRCSEIRVDGRLVAWDVAILSCRRLYSLKTTYAEDFAALSPGLVLRRAIVERCFALGLDGHEFGGRDMGWKRRFATSARASNSLRVDRVRPKPLARLAYQRLARPFVDPLRARRSANADERWPPPPLRAALDER
jgi:CelD/BcsL family acetyltransferase involved in cellulose biosynthesis